jgi:hypothetical protein
MSDNVRPIIKNITIYSFDHLADIIGYTVEFIDEVEFGVVGI